MIKWSERKEELKGIAGTLTKEDYLYLICNAGVRLYGAAPADTGKKYSYRVTIRGFADIGLRAQVNADLYLSEIREAKEKPAAIDTKKIKGLEL
jgi:hypothetical protein